MLSRKGCKVCRQCRNINELEAAVKKAWDSIPAETVASLVQSMQEHFVECCLAKGGLTEYYAVLLLSAE